jgi:hypothetical protein
MSLHIGTPFGQIAVAQTRVQLPIRVMNEEENGASEKSISLSVSRL